MRLDRALTERGLARSRNQAAQLIGQGKVTVGGRLATKAAQPVGPEDEIHVSDQLWVSRAALKLEGALDQSATIIPPRVLDAGASTGGFTQVCLDRGAERVYAVDVGHDQFAAELRHDARVKLYEGLNLRDLTPAHVDDCPVDMVVADVSFISLTLILEPMLGVLRSDGFALLLVKPQFEVGRAHLGAGGVVADEAARIAAVARVVEHAADLGWQCTWQGVSTLPGVGGNREYFVKIARL